MEVLRVSDVLTRLAVVQLIADKVRLGVVLSVLGAPIWLKMNPRASVEGRRSKEGLRVSDVLTRLSVQLIVDKVGSFPASLLSMYSRFFKASTVVLRPKVLRVA